MAGKMKDLGFEILTCADCPHLSTNCCPREEADATQMECFPRTDLRKALEDLEEERKRHGQQSLAL